MATSVRCSSPSLPRPCIIALLSLRPCEELKRDVGRGRGSQAALLVRPSRTYIEVRVRPKNFYMGENGEVFKEGHGFFVNMVKNTVELRISDTAEFPHQKLTKSMSTLLTIVPPKIIRFG